MKPLKRKEKLLLFHDLLLSFISQHNDWSELLLSYWTPAVVPPHSENNSAMKHKGTLCYLLNTIQKTHKTALPQLTVS